MIVPTWNRRDLLENILKQLHSQTASIDEVVVVDNGSTDDTAAVAGEYGARVILLARNAGFAGAVNRGIAESRGEWLAILNNDVELEPDWLERLMEASDQAWFATGKTLSAGNRQVVDGTFDVMCRGACAWRCGQGRLEGPVWSEAQRIRMAPFTAALFRKELFQKIGMLDERFESYLEDVDFGLRCALAGYDGVYVPQAVAYHRGSATLGAWHGETVRRIARNQVYLVAKHYPAGTLARWSWPILVAQTLWGLVALRHGASLAWLRGKIQGLAAFRRLRETPAASREFEELVEGSEKKLRDLQQRGGSDLYWRLYFALT